MQRLNSVIAFCLTFCLILMSIPFSALASDTSQFEFTLNGESSVSITKYNGTDTNVVIPDTIDGMTVTSIGQSAFANNLYLQTITFPDTLTTIGSQAFRSCIKLQSVSFPESLLSIGDQAFFGCNSLVSVEAMPYLQTIGLQAFHNTRWFVNAPTGFLYVGRVLYQYIGIASEGTVITVPDYTASIAAGAFENQYNVIKCYLPVGLRFIGDYAFSSCDSLEFIRIPPSVSSFGNAVFLNSGAVTVHGVTQSAAHIYALENELYFSSDATLDYPDGDMDKDGELSSTDIRIMMRAVVLSEDCDHERFLSCDIVYDGKIATNDIREWMLVSIS